MMNKRLIAMWLCLGLGAGATKASIPILQLDINHPDNNTAAQTEEGFTPFTLADSGTVVNGVKIEFEGTLDSRRRDAPAGVPFEQVYRDFLFSRPGGMTVTLSGLMPNALYEVTVYAFDASSEGLRVGDWMSGPERVLQARFLNTETPTQADDYAFSGLVSANANGAIVLEVVAGEGTREASGANDPFGFLNALVLSLVTDPSRALNPHPSNQAIDVPYDTTVLSWTSGRFAQTHDVYIGTTYDDVSAADRANPMGVLVSQGQTATSYDPPDWLDFGTTYYWRVDEVNGPPDNAIYKGDVWSFAVEPKAYPIRGVVATSNGDSDADLGPENVVDGSGLDALDQHSIDGGDMWLAAPVGDEPLHIAFEFDRLYKLHELLIWNYNVMFEPMLGFGLKDVTVEYSVDGTDWMTLGDVSLAQATARNTYTYNTTVDLGGVAARYVRLIVNSSFGTIGEFGLSEVRFLYIPVQARELEPASGATDVGPDVQLSWRAGRDVVAHEVHLSTDESQLIENADGTAPVAVTTEPQFDTDGLLELGRTYYWRVDELSAAGSSDVWEGEIWSFSTQPSIVVEDFEQYNDEENTIFDTWIDGWVNNTGSTVGYLQSPFAEQTIVHGGGQSMPLFYDSASAAVSEAVRTFDQPQDWTRHGVKALTLWFYGDLANMPGQMYVEVNGSRVLYGGDAENLRVASWQFWYVDLTGFAGADLRNVTQVTIGLEGGNGRLFIDDIALSPLDRNSIVPTEPDAGNLVGHFALEGNVNDSSGTHNGVVVGSPVFASGRIGQAIQLDGVADYVRVEGSYDLPTYSAALWFRVDGGTGERDLLSVYDSAGAHGILLELRGDGTLRFLHRAPVGTSGGMDIYSTATADDGAWHHVGIVKTAHTRMLYINGAVAGRADDSSEFGQVLQNITIGVLKHDNLIRHFPGAIDEVYLYGRALSDGEIAWLAGRTAPFDTP